MKLCVLIIGLASLLFQADAAPTVRWDRVDYSVQGRPLTMRQKQVLEASLRKRCRCPVQQVRSGGNLVFRLGRTPHGGTCTQTPRGARILVDPSDQDGFATITDHEVRHLVEPVFRHADGLIR